jgi:hypothetical protein
VITCQFGKYLGRLGTSLRSLKSHSLGVEIDRTLVKWLLVKPASLGGCDAFYVCKDGRAEGRGTKQVGLSCIYVVSGCD